MKPYDQGMKKMGAVCAAVLLLTACAPSAPPASPEPSPTVSGDLYCDATDIGAPLMEDTIDRLLRGATPLKEQADAMSEFGRLLRTSAPNSNLNDGALDVTRFADALLGGRAPSVDERQAALNAVDAAQSYCAR